MLVIRDDQLPPFQEAPLRRFVAEVLPVLRRAWPSRCAGVPPDELSDEILEAVKAARAYGVTGEHSVTDFLHLRMMYGHRFPHPPAFAWADAILADPGADETEKLRRLKAAAAAGARAGSPAPEARGAPDAE